MRPPRRQTNNCLKRHLNYSVRNSMNLNSLFSFGQSLLGFRTTKPTYQISKGNLVPDFGNTKFEFVTDANSSVVVEDEPVELRISQATPLAIESEAVDESKETVEVEGIEPRAERTNPFAIFSGRSRVSKVKQTELPLSGVAVVRNDLTDDDYSVVSGLAPRRGAIHREKAQKLKTNPFSGAKELQLLND
jgi:hypothetical protein